jgi:hypothetical protein
MLCYKASDVSTMRLYDILIIIPQVNSTTSNPLLDMPTSPASTTLAFRSRPTTPPQYAFHQNPNALPYSSPSTPFRRESPKSDHYLAPNAAALYSHAQVIATTPSPPVSLNNDTASPVPAAVPPGPQSTVMSTQYATSTPGMTRLPPILGVEKQQVTTSATQMASASRRRNEAHFLCPVPGCGSTFTRRFNLRGMCLCSDALQRTLTHFVLRKGHLRSHTEERPYVCEWPGCQKGFARQHDCKCV